MRYARLALALLFAALLSAPGNATFPNRGTYPAIACGTHSVTVTATGGGSFTANGCPITFKVWGAGASGNETATNNKAGGVGGGACTITLTPSGGTTVYYSVGTGGAGVGGTTSNAGTNSWVNISANAQPSSATNGCYASGGGASLSNACGTVGAGTYGTDFSGGTCSHGSGNGAGGGGAGTTGNGGAASGSTGGSGGTPDGGAGANLNGGAGTQPGGGGGAAGSGTSGAGANGQVAYSF